MANAKVRESAIQWMNENMEDTKQLVSECNGWDSSLESFYYYQNDEDTWTMLYGDNIAEFARASYYGDWKYQDDLVKIDGYGNLKSCSDYDYENELSESMEEILDAVIECQDNIDVPDELLEILEGEKDDSELEIENEVEDKEFTIRVQPNSDYWDSEEDTPYYVDFQIDGEKEYFLSFDNEEAEQFVQMLQNASEDVYTFEDIVIINNDRLQAFVYGNKHFEFTAEQFEEIAQFIEGRINFLNENE